MESKPTLRRRDKEIGGVSLLAWLILLVLALTWGSSYILIKKGLVSFTPQQVAWVLSSLTPLATLLLGISFFKIKSTWTKITGVLIGLAGAIWLLLVDKDGGEWTGFQFGLLVVLACLFYGVSTNVIKTHLTGLRSLTISAVSYSMVGIPALAYLFSSGFVQVFERDEKAWVSFGFLGLLAVFGTVIGSLLYFKLIKMTNALFASTVSYLTPMVAILQGSLDGETITLLHFAGMAMILTGVYVARR